MNILIISDQKREVTERMKKYATFDFKKVDFNDLPKIENGRYVDYDYLYDFVGDYDGVMAVFDGNELEGVWGNYKHYRGKHIIQVENNHKRRKWKLGATGWKLVGSRDGEYDQYLYTAEHELGHALCKENNEKDNLHLFIKLKQYEQWWDYKDFPQLDWDMGSTRIEWWHEKRGKEIKPKCYVLHCDLGTEESTRGVIVDSPKSVSYNYYINKDGEVIEYVPFGFEAWHSGVVHNPTPEAKKFFGNKNPNSMSVGICFESRGEDANAKQEQAIRDLISEHGLMPIFAHKEITSYKPQAPLNLKRKLNNLQNESEVKWWLKLLAKFLR